MVVHYATGGLFGHLVPIIIIIRIISTITITIIMRRRMICSRILSSHRCVLRNDRVYISEYSEYLEKKIMIIIEWLGKIYHIMPIVGCGGVENRTWTFTRRLRALCSHACIKAHSRSRIACHQLFVIRLLYSNSPPPPPKKKMKIKLSSHTHSHPILYYTRRWLCVIYYITL